MTEMPSSIRVGPMDMCVLRVKRFKGEASGGLYLGMVRHDTSTIEIRVGLSPDQERCALVHEVLHELLTQAGIQEDCTERGVSTLSSGIVAVLRDNPYFREV